MQIAVFRLIAIYVLVMGVATGIHVILTPAIYADATSTPLAWVIMNPMNCIAAGLMMIAGAARKIVYDRARRAADYADSTIKYLDHNVPFYAAALLTILYLVNTVGEGVANNSIEEIWYYLDAGIAVVGITTGIRILRSTGMRIIYDA